MPCQKIDTNGSRTIFARLLLPALLGRVLHLLGFGSHLFSWFVVCGSLALALPVSQSKVPSTSIMGSHSIAQHWSVGTVALSYVISVTGSYCSTLCVVIHTNALLCLLTPCVLIAIQLMEQWRLESRPGMRKSML